MCKVILNFDLVLKRCLESGNKLIVAKELGVSIGTISKLFKDNNIKVRDFKKEKFDIDFIVKELSSGKTVKDIASELGTYNTTIRRYLLRYGIKPKTPSETQKLVKDITFTSLSREAMYWIGFLAADGGITTTSNKIYLGTVEKDKAHLEKYSKFVGIPITTVYNKRFDLYEYRVIFGNKSLKEWFISIGITPVKSKTLQLNINITPDTFRGILDGDGTVTKKGNISIATASEKFKQQLLDFLEEHHIQSTHSKAKSSSVWVVRVSKISERKKLFELLYKDAPVYLERKYNRIYASLFGNI